ncbi:hypothetical protein D3C71_1831150 [compost metagenome]
MRQLPVIGESGGAEIYVTLAFISEALINETLNKCNNLWNMVGYSRIKSRLVNAKRFQIGIKSLNKPLSNLGHSRAKLLGLPDQLIVNIGEVNDIAHLIPDVL